MATYEENLAAIRALEQEIEALRDSADSDIATKNAQIGVIAAEARSQEQTCGHTSWSKVEDEWKLQCDDCGKIVEFSSPVMLWPWAS